MGPILCHPCDLFVGYYSAGVILPPSGLTETELESCCWGCKRTSAEIQEENSARYGIRTG